MSENTEGEIEKIREEIELLKKQNKRDRIFRRWRFWVLNTDKLIMWGGLCILGLFAYLSIDSLAGKDTSIVADVEIVSNFKFEIGAFIMAILCFLFTIIRTRNLSNKSLRHSNNHITLLERRLRGMGDTESNDKSEEDESESEEDAP